MAKVENTEQTPKRKGKGAMNGNETGRSFTSENQPSPEAKSEGMKRHWSTKKMLEAVAGKFSDSQTDFAKLTADYYGVTLEQVTVKMIMDFRQLEKAIKKGDTRAYEAVNDRAFGKPRNEGWDAPPPQAEEAPDRQKSVIDLGNGIIFEI